jgi:co-chaperonin GroES (HSP10)
MAEKRIDDAVIIGKKHLLVVGDRLLVSPMSAGERTHTGLYLPDSAAEGKKVSGGWVEAVGPGYPVSSSSGFDEEPWKQGSGTRLQYIPLQARKGDFAMYVRSSAFELSLEGKKFFVVPYSAVLALLREDWETPELDREEPI